MPKDVKCGDIVRLKNSPDCSLGGWLYGEIATVIEGNGPRFAPILVRLHNEHLARVEQGMGELRPGIVAVHASNLEKGDR